MAPPRCDACKKKLMLAECIIGACRCGGSYCATHREAAAHACTHDFHKEQQQRLAQEGHLTRPVASGKLSDRL